MQDKKVGFLMIMEATWRCFLRSTIFLLLVSSQPQYMSNWYVNNK